jgi:hypothetical protein
MSFISLLFEDGPIKESSALYSISAAPAGFGFFEC